MRLNLYRCTSLSNRKHIKQRKCVCVYVVSYVELLFLKCIRFCNNQKYRKWNSHSQKFSTHGKRTMAKELLGMRGCVRRSNISIPNDPVSFSTFHLNTPYYTLWMVHKRQYSYRKICRRVNNKKRTIAHNHHIVCVYGLQNGACDRHYTMVQLDWPETMASVQLTLSFWSWMSWRVKHPIKL